MAEYQRQLKIQQAGLNAKPACKNVADIDKFDSQTADEKAEQRASGDDEREKTIAAYKAANPNQSLGDLNALHRIDMVVGGSATDFAGMGNARINKSIGASWNTNNRKTDLKNYAAEMCQKKCKMAVILDVCNTQMVPGQITA